MNYVYFEKNPTISSVDHSRCTNCKMCVDCKNCTDCIKCTDCSNCTNCVECSGCKNCHNCKGLVNKSNRIGNVKEPRSNGVKCGAESW